MKKYSFVLLIGAVAAQLLFGCTRGYESQKNADDMKITLFSGRYPLVKGDNQLTLKVIDASGKAVPDATVSVRYFMPPMPGMAPMDYSTLAVRKGDAYAFSANIPMEGGWKAEVSVARPGKPAASAIFNIDSR
jgi:hypothetical protein